MSEDQHSGGAGGAGNEAGAEFRARVAAWIVTHAIAGRRIEVLDLPEGRDIPSGLILPETDAPVDDLEVHLSGGVRLYIQAKRSLSLSSASDSEFAKTVRQLAKQVSNASFDSSNTRLAIVVGQSTGPLRNLQRILSRHHQKIAAAPTKEEDEALANLVTHLGPLTDDQLKAVMGATVVVILDLDTPESPHREACIAWLSHVVNVGSGEAAWKQLELKARNLAAQRFGIDLDGWLDVLRRGGVTLRADRFGAPGSKREATLRAVERYRESLVAQGRRMSLRALYDGVPDLEITPDARKNVLVRTGRTNVGLSWLVRRWARVLLTGLPGIGKSTALRRLAAENAAMTLGPLPVMVTLPRFAELLSSGGNALELLVDVGLADLPEDDRPLVRQEAISQFRTGGRAVLLLDALDECRARRHDVVDRVRQAMSELHQDVEVVLATRDVAYAHASVLGLREAILQPPLDLYAALHVLASHLAKAQGVPQEAQEVWAHSIVESVTVRGDEVGSFRQTPLAAIGMVLLASEAGVETIQRGSTTVLSKLVDWLARRWEVDERRRGEINVSAALTLEESTAFLTQAFDIIAYEIDGCDSLTQSDLAERLERWAVQIWQLPIPRARTAASAALAFWDEAGVFVATGATAIVRARQMMLQEIGVARWLARHADVTQCATWLERNVNDSNKEEIVVLLAGMHTPAALALIKYADTSNDLRLKLLAARALSEASDKPFVKERTVMVTRLTDILVQDLERGDAAGWKVLEALLLLPLDADESAVVLSTVRKHYESSRADLAESTGALRWNNAEDVDDSTLLATLVAGPSTPWPLADESGAPLSRFIENQIDPLYQILARELASRVTPSNGDLFRILVLEGRVSMDTHIQVVTTLSRRGYGELVGQIRQREGKDNSLAVDMMRRSEEARVKLLEVAGALGKPGALTYMQRRRMSELVDFLETAVPGDTVSGAWEVVIQERLDFARFVLALVARHGEFDVDVIASQVSCLGDDGMRDNLWMSFDASPRDLSFWPDDSDARGAALIDILRLFTGTLWTAGIAARALEHFPDMSQAAIGIDLALHAVSNRRVRKLAALTLLSIDSRGVDRARTWMTGEHGDIVLSRVGAMALAHFCLQGEVLPSEVELLLVATDEATREMMKKILERGSHSPEVSQLIDVLRSLAPSDWMCTWCDQINMSGTRWCKSCREAR